MERITGNIDVYRFYDEDSGYSVIKLENGKTVVGILPHFNAGESVEFTGEWGIHQKFGEQFKAESFRVLYPDTSEGIIKFLSSRIIKGIGERTAKKIVSRFGAKTIDILDNHIERLLEISGFGSKKIETIRKSWEDRKGIRNVIMSLQSFGISTSVAMKIYNIYGDDAVKIIKSNPYRLVSDVWGIGFKTADRIGSSAGFGDAHPYRIQAGILHVLSESARSGHVYLPEYVLIDYCRSLINFELTESDPNLVNLVDQGHIYIEGDKVYLSSLYYAEKESEFAVKRLVESEPADSSINKKLLSAIGGGFTSEQFEAIQNSLRHKMLILTGGPGTGKTETLKGIIRLYEELGKKILLAAPTGRAAKRMTEVIGTEARTIHRLLEYNPSAGLFNRSGDNQLETDLLVIDEVSMIDTLLLHSLMEAVSGETTLILAGDVNQLPAVGPGNILADLIASELIPVVKLTKIFRQAEQSRIIVAAYEINRGVIPDLTIDKDGDFFFIEENDENSIPGIILDLCQRRLPAKYSLNPFNDIQVISPMHKGATGTAQMNKTLQEGLNSNGILLKSGSMNYRMGDKVMQLRNNYEKDIFNGDVGIVTGFDAVKRKLQINFGRNVIDYDSADLDEITLAYTITVHKSQGSEYPCVILPLTTSHYVMLQRNLLYTAVTRASRMMIIVGTKNAIAVAVNNSRVQGRYTSFFK